MNFLESMSATVFAKPGTCGLSKVILSGRLFCVSKNAFRKNAEMRFGNKLIRFLLRNRTVRPSLGLFLSIGKVRGSTNVSFADPGAITKLLYFGPHK